MLYIRHSSCKKKTFALCWNKQVNSDVGPYPGIKDGTGPAPGGGILKFGGGKPACGGGPPPGGYGTCIGAGGP